MEETKNKAKKLNESSEEKIAGGYIVEDGGAFRFVLLDDTGQKVLGRYRELNDAKAAAGRNNVSADLICEEDYYRLLDDYKRGIKFKKNI